MKTGTGTLISGDAGIANLVVLEHICWLCRSSVASRQPGRVCECIAGHVTLTPLELVWAVKRWFINPFKQCLNCNEQLICREPFVRIQALLLGIFYPKMIWIHPPPNSTHDH